jgi:hypothetical protein
LWEKYGDVVMVRTRMPPRHGLFPEGERNGKNPVATAASDSDGYGNAQVFSLWKDRLFALKEEDRAKFLMFNIIGGSWLLAVFSISGGVYFLFDSVFSFSI